MAFDEKIDRFSFWVIIAALEALKYNSISELKNNDNIEFSPGNIPLKDIEEKLASRKCALAFLLFPPTIEQVNKVADEGLNMPPKSTWLEPKLRSGLTIYSINE